MYANVEDEKGLVVEKRAVPVKRPLLEKEVFTLEPHATKIFNAHFKAEKVKKKRNRIEPHLKRLF